MIDSQLTTLLKLAIAACLFSAAVGPVSRAATPPGQDWVEEVLVTGERPGPGMWRVSKGSHDLWILASLDPLPKKMFWRSRVVEKKIASSSLVLAPPEVMIDIRFFSNPMFRDALTRARRDPGGQTLSQELPPNTYLRWKSLESKYLPQDSYEHTRPVLAAVELYESAVDKSGLNADDHTIWRIVQKNARAHRVRILAITVDWQRGRAFNWLREFNEIPRADEVACLETTIDRIETDLGPMRQRANLWSVGDIEGLLAQTYPDDRMACFKSMFSTSKWRDQLERAYGQLSNSWLTAVDNALDKNRSSFAVLPIGRLLAADGWLAKLRARGYSIEEPK